ncbi:MAG: hypothetical protein HC913_03005 [Microscillaceae bacterium]|nr:hypothetical protein [Microscillaceae bacterium]
MDFTPEELQDLKEQDFWRRKQVIHQKVLLLLGHTEAALGKALAEQDFDFPPHTHLRAGKISRGERYLELPYWILDYPRLLQKENIFALRTMLWWGHEFSCTLHLQGKPWQEYQKMLQKNWPQLRGQGFYLCVHPHPWAYYYAPDNYLLMDEMPDLVIETHLAQGGFLKLSRPLGLEASVQLPDFVCQSWQILRLALQS